MSAKLFWHPVHIPSNVAVFFVIYFKISHSRLTSAKWNETEKTGNNFFSPLNTVNICWVPSFTYLFPDQQKEVNFHWLLQKRHNSSASALEEHLFCNWDPSGFKVSSASTLTIMRVSRGSLHTARQSLRQPGHIVDIQPRDGLTIKGDLTWKPDKNKLVRQAK